MHRKLLTILILGICLVGCAEKRTPAVKSSASSVDSPLDIPDKMVSKSALYYDSQKSLWMLDKELFSGYAVTYYQDSTLKEKFGILNGKKENLSIQYDANGRSKYASTYHKGKLNGDKKAWSADSTHTLLSHLQYSSGKLHGEQKKWYPTGELFKKLNLNMGKEEGLQQAYRKNGALYANYEAKEGRIFGLKKAALCYGLEDENMNYGN